ncbi:fimbrial biogenesis outer membrane usher protein [Sphingomonas koreensis]|nr:fimbrial biogenesis outer membrane usher protein [Sphingomonas koreensis]
MAGAMRARRFGGRLKLHSSVSAVAFVAALQCATPAAAAAAVAVDQAGQHAPADPVRETPASAAAPVPPDIKPTTLSLPIVVDDAQVGTALATVTLSDIVSISVADLNTALASRISKETASAITALGNGQIKAAAIRQAGLDLHFDTASLAIVVTIPDTRRGIQVLQTPGISFDGLAPVDPARFAFGMTGALLINKDLSGGPTTGDLATAGFLNVGGLTGLNVLFSGDLRFGAGATAFERNGIVAFKDDPARAMRYSIGDIIPLQARLAGPVDLLGVSVERSYESIQPERNIRPVGQSGFVLQRRSTVEVYVNGVLAQTFVANPGPINLRNIPLADISNNVSVVVEDPLGRREVESFQLGNDISQLQEGISEFSASLGLLRDVNAAEFRYTDDPVASLYFTRGLTERLTVGAHAVIAQHAQNAGFSAAMPILAGVGQIETAISHSDDRGTGAAIGVTYRGDPFGLRRLNGFLDLRVDYQTIDYNTLSSFTIGDQTKWDGLASYRIDLSSTTSAYLGGGYYEIYGQSATYSAYVGASHRFGRLSFSASLRYEKRSTDRGGLGILGTISMPLGRHTSAYGSYDSNNNVGQVEVRKQRGIGVPDYEYSLAARYSPNQSQVTGDIGYVNSRFDASAGVAQYFQGDLASNERVATVRLQSGIAFVDGTFGIGRDPGNGFLMVKRHPTLRPADVNVKSAAVGEKLGVADGLGPAVVSINGPYLPQEVTLSVPSAPIGYDLGPGEYVLRPGAASGLAITAGTDAYHIAGANLYDGEGHPLALTTGVVTDLNTGAGTPFFTNSQGRAVFIRLAPGQYRVTMDSSKAVFKFVVGQHDPAFVKLPDLHAEPAP